MRIRRPELFFRAAAAAGAPVPSPAPGPALSQVTAALLTLTLPPGAQTLDVGAAATAALAPGITGNFTFTREAPSAATTAATTNAGLLVIGAGSGNSATYTGQSADADKRLNVVASNLAFASGLTSALDPAAVLSLYGSGAVGSTLSASLIAGTRGTVSILRGDGAVVATANDAASVNYTVAAGVAGPFTATASNLVLSGAFSTGGSPAPDPTPFVTAQSYMYGSTVAANDTFAIRLAEGVTGTINFQSNGVQVTSNGVGANTSPQLNSWSYEAQPSDAGHSIGYTVSNLSFTTGGIYGTPVLQSATGAPMLYSLEITVDAPNRIRIGVPALANLDTASLPPTSAFTLTGTLATSKTVTAVAYDNSDLQTKFVYLTLSSKCIPGDAPTLAYSGTAIRYAGGGTPMAAFTQPVFSAIPPPAALMFTCTDKQGLATSPAPGVAHFVVSDQWVADVVLSPSQSSGDRNSTTQDCSIQMSISADWGTDTGVLRCVALNASPNTYGVWYWEQYSLHRTGNTVSLWEAPVVPRASGQQAGSGYAFLSPSSLCLARVRRQADDGLVRMETSEDGGITWTQRAISTISNTGTLFPTAYSNSTTVSVTGVGTNGFSPL